MVAGQGRVYKCLEVSKFEGGFSSGCRGLLTARQKIGVLESVKTDRAFVLACGKDMGESDCVQDVDDGVGLVRVMLCLESHKRAGKLCFFL